MVPAYAVGAQEAERIGRAVANQPDRTAQVIAQAALSPLKLLTLIYAI
jgi:hypothetical protein